MPSDVSSFASANDIEAELQVRLRSTQGIFGNRLRMVVEEDAEIEGDWHLVFNVTASAEVNQVLAMEDEWHDRCVSLAAKAAPHVRLLVNIE